MRDILDLAGVIPAVDDAVGSAEIDDEGRWRVRCRSVGRTLMGELRGADSAGGLRNH